MFEYIIILFCLISSSNLKYVSLAQKEIGIDIDDICYFLDEKDLGDSRDDIEYVKPCEPQYYCRKLVGQKIGTCEKYTPIIKTLNENCTSDYECDLNLECIKGTCLVQNQSIAYSKQDIDSNEYFYCPNYLMPILTGSDFICEQKENYKTMDDMCFNETITAFPYYFKICAKLTLLKDDNGIYQMKNVTANYIGSIEDGEFVIFSTACKSGYALCFYGDKNITKPQSSNGDSNTMYKMCVTINEVEKFGSSCYIKYSIGDKTNIYNTAKVEDDDNNDLNEINEECELIMTKIKLFKQYTENMNKIKDTCETVRYYNEPFTCGNDVLRKLWYYYNNPDKYLLYKNDEDIINYLIQETYPLYGFESNLTDANENSFYLKIKYFIFLLFLLSL